MKYVKTYENFVDKIADRIQGNFTKRKEILDKYLNRAIIVDDIRIGLKLYHNKDQYVLNCYDSGYIDEITKLSNIDILDIDTYIKNLLNLKKVFDSKQFFNEIDEIFDDSFLLRLKDERNEKFEIFEKFGYLKDNITVTQLTNEENPKIACAIEIMSEPRPIEFNVTNKYIETIKEILEEKIKYYPNIHYIIEGGIIKTSGLTPASLIIYKD